MSRSSLIPLLTPLIQCNVLVILQDTTGRLDDRGRMRRKHSLSTSSLTAATRDINSREEAHSLLRHEDWKNLVLNKDWQCRHTAEWKKLIIYKSAHKFDDLHYRYVFRFFIFECDVTTLWTSFCSDHSELYVLHAIIINQTNVVSAYVNDPVVMS
jgi:hypothetical protein